MIVRPEHIVEFIWIGWLMSWLTASFWSDRVQKHLAAPQTWTYRAALIAGGILLAPPTAWLLSEVPLWRLGYRGTFVLLAIMLIGLLHLVGVHRPRAALVKRYHAQRGAQDHR